MSDELTALATRIGAVLTARHQTLAVAETSAGGTLCQAITSVPGSSAWFVAGVVVYSLQSRALLLDLGGPRPTGAVSAEHAVALASRVRRRLEADWGVAETGVAGPTTGRRSAKEPGTGYVAVIGRRDGEDVVLWRETSAPGADRVAHQRAFAHAALGLLADALQV